MGAGVLSSIFLGTTLDLHFVLAVVNVVCSIALYSQAQTRVRRLCRSLVRVIACLHVFGHCMRSSNVCNGLRLSPSLTRESAHTYQVGVVSSPPTLPFVKSGSGSESEPLTRLHEVI